MKNAYEIRGDVTAIIINSPTYGRFETMISTSKLERAMEFPNTWRVQWNGGTKSFYVQGNSPRIKGERTAIILHRWMTNAPDGMQVDHINHDTLDNTDSNLRIVTQYENQQNKKGSNKNNKSSGIRGVTWHKQLKKWQVQIKFNKKLLYLGCYSDIKDAELKAIESRNNYMTHNELDRGVRV